MEALFGLAKAVSPDLWLFLSLLVSAVVIGVHWMITHLVGRDAARDDTEARAQLDSDRELLGS